MAVLCLAVVVPVVFPAGTAVLTPADAASSAMQPGPLWTSDCSTSQLSDIIAAYTSTPAPKSTPTVPPRNPNSYLRAVLKQRLTQCADKLKDFASVVPNNPNYTPKTACSPDPTQSVSQLWQQLQFCAALVNLPAVSAPTSIKWDLPSTTGGPSQPVIFVFGVAGDPAMLAKLTSTLTHYLTQTASYIVDDAKVIPEPGMTTNDFIGQCAQSSQVKGAIVVAITAAGSGSSDQFISRKNWNSIEATALYADCQRSRQAAPGVPAYVWASNLEWKSNHYITPTPLTPLALLLTLGAAYEIFAPARTTATQTTHVYPTPLPLPTSGRISSVQTTSSQTLNASSLSSVALGFLSSSITYTNSYAPLTGPPTVDQQTWDTLADVAAELVRDMNCWRLPDTAMGRQRLSDVQGRPREVPSYNPPPGLLSTYTTSAPSAPFCAEPNTVTPTPTPGPPAPETPQPPPSGGESIQDIMPSPLPTSTAK